MAGLMPPHLPDFEFLHSPTLVGPLACHLCAMSWVWRASFFREDFLAWFMWDVEEVVVVLLIA